MNLVKQMEEGCTGGWKLHWLRPEREAFVPGSSFFCHEVPREKQHGDFACNVAMLLARQARMAPALCLLLFLILIRMML